MLLNARGQHDHGKVFSPPQLLQHRQAVEDGEHHVENHQIVGAVTCSVQAIPAVVNTIQMMASLGKELLHHPA